MSACLVWLPNTSKQTPRKFPAFHSHTPASPALKTAPVSGSAKHLCRTSHGDTAMCLLAQHRQEKQGSGWAQTSGEWFARQAESRHAGAAGTSWAVGFQSMSLLLQGKESNNCPLRQTSTTEGDECSGLNSPKPKLSME